MEKQFIFSSDIMGKEWLEVYEKAWREEDRKKLLELLNDFEKKAMKERESFLPIIMTCMECGEKWIPHRLEKEGICPKCGCNLFDVKIYEPVKEVK